MGRAKKAGTTVKGSASNSPTPESEAAMSPNESPKEVWNYFVRIDVNNGMIF